MRSNILQDTATTYRLVEEILQAHLPTSPVLSSPPPHNSFHPVDENDMATQLSSLIQYLQSVSTFTVPLSRIVQQTGYPEHLVRLLLQKLISQGLVSVSPFHPGVYTLNPRLHQ